MCSSRTLLLLFRLGLLVEQRQDQIEYIHHNKRHCEQNERYKQAFPPEDGRRITGKTAQAFREKLAADNYVPAHGQHLYQDQDGAGQAELDPGCSPAFFSGQQNRVR